MSSGSSTRKLQLMAYTLHFLCLSPDDHNIMNDLHAPVFRLLSGRIRKRRYVLAHARRRFSSVLFLSFVFKGWDADEPGKDGIDPEVLVSLTAPKKCATGFSGKHFLAGRFLPYDIQKKYELNLPEFPGTDCVIQL